MSVKEKIRKALLIGTIGLGLLTGWPMRPEEIENLMQQMNRPKMAHVLREESEEREDPI